MSNGVEAFEQAHRENYYNATKELIHNNTKAFVYDDLFPLFEKPPLDSMDLVKNQLLSLAKANQTLLQVEAVDKQLDAFRKKMKKELEKLGEEREKILLEKIESFVNQENDTIKILKKDFTKTDGILKKKLEATLTEQLEKYILNDTSAFFDSKSQNFLTLEKQLKQFMEKKYPKQILEKFALKIFVKDTILLNSIKEQTERYLFTKENSHLFD